MNSHDRSIRFIDASLLGGITLGDWFRILYDNRFAIAPNSIGRALTITALSLPNTLFRWVEYARYSRQSAKVVVPPPLFILGHWRSGTTHLHNLLSIDPRFAFPNNYQVFFPHAFLTLEAIQTPIIQHIFPKQRPMDNIEWTVQSPQEDEFAQCVTTFKSPYMGWMFPAQREAYDRYLTLRDVGARELAQWKAGLVAFLQRLTLKYQRPLLLKSPTHTCRIKLLLELFPQAKFLHVRRNPFAVFPSTRKMLTTNFAMHTLQRPRLHDLDEWIIRQYQIMYEVFFAERDLIPAGNFHEIAYEALENDPIGQLQHAYEVLGLPDFGQTQPALEDYVRSLVGYQKNVFSPLSEDLRQRLATEWRFCFDRWGYDPSAPPVSQP